MKKAKFFFTLLLGMVLGVGIAIGVYFLTVGEVAWKQYLEEKLVPSVAAVICALFAVRLGVSPVLKKVVNATLLFNKATDCVNTTVENNKEANNNIERFKKDISKTVTEAIATGVKNMQEQNERIKRIEQHSSNAEEIARIGFGNMEELVNKGFAAEIAKVGADNEENEK